MTKYTAKYRQTILLFLEIFLISLILDGCSTVSVISKQASKADDIYKKTSVAFLWSNSNHIDTTNVPDTGYKHDGLQFVGANTNWFYSLCNLATLGAVAPVSVKYICRSSSTETTDLALWWGLCDAVENVKCPGNGLQIVNLKTNWIYSLCTVITFGLVAPVDEEFRSTSTPMQNGGTIGMIERRKP
jgi:hypothetical protein